MEEDATRVELNNRVDLELKAGWGGAGEGPGDRGTASGVHPTEGIRLLYWQLEAEFWEDRDQWG